MTVIPLVRRITVLRRGTEYTERGKIPLGGHVRPNSTVGAIEAS